MDMGLECRTIQQRYVVTNVAVAFELPAGLFGDGDQSLAEHQRIGHLRQPFSPSFRSLPAIHGSFTG